MNEILFLAVCLKERFSILLRGMLQVERLPWGSFQHHQRVGIYVTVLLHIQIGHLSIFPLLESGVELLLGWIPILALGLWVSKFGIDLHMYLGLFFWIEISKG